MIPLHNTTSKQLEHQLIRLIPGHVWRFVCVLFVFLFCVMYVITDLAVGHSTSNALRLRKTVGPSGRVSPEPMDVVIPWVNGSDPVFMASLREYAEKEGIHLPFDRDSARWREFDELRYVFRSIEKNAPWVRKIHLITNGQVPRWLNVQHHALNLVHHEDFIPKENLPTFSSVSIEANLHRLTNIAPRFIYLNDDTFFQNPVDPSDFYTSGGGSRLMLTYPVPDCAPGCAASWIADGHCDRVCNVSECQFDGGDCEGIIDSTDPDSFPFSITSPAATTFMRRYCASGCLTAWLTDGFCDSACDVASCAFDAGDCGLEKTINGSNLVSNFTTDMDITVDPDDNYYSLSLNFSFNDNRCQGNLASYTSDPDEVFIRTAAIHKDLGLLTILFRPPKERQSALDGLVRQHSVVVSCIDAEETTNISLTLHFEVGNVSMTESSDEESSKPQKPRIDEEPIGLDTYGASLVTTDQLLTSKYGYEARRVPAHLPMVIDSSVLKDCYEAFPNEWKNTSAHKFRHPFDIQFGLIYHYFLMSEPMARPSPHELFEILDLNHDGNLQPFELRNALAMLSDTLTQSIVTWFDESIHGNSSIPYGKVAPISAGFSRLQRHIKKLQNISDDHKEIDTTFDGWLVLREFDWISEAQFIQAESLIEALLAAMDMRRKYSFSERDVEGYGHFVSIGNDPEGVLRAMTEVLHKKSKLLCLNDDLSTASENDTHTIIRYVTELLETLFPEPSSFEIDGPNAKPNSRSFDDVLAARRAKKANFLVRIVLVLVCSFAGTFFILWRVISNNQTAKIT